jgi:hypothetical protein
VDRGGDQTEQKLGFQNSPLESDLLARSSCRSILLVSFIESTLMVVRPTAATPSITGPGSGNDPTNGHAADQNNVTLSPMIGSIPVRFWALAQIAAVTGKGQIGVIVAPTMLAGYEVLDMMRERRAILGKEAIFATVPGSSWDESPRRRLHRYLARKAACGLSISELRENHPR